MKKKPAQSKQNPRQKRQKSHKERVSTENCARGADSETSNTYSAASGSGSSAVNADQAGNEDTVRLKPFMGIRPGIYLTAIYSFILLLILFFLFIFPGLINNGSVLIVETWPGSAAIRVDDVYMGVAGSRIFLPNGTYMIKAVMPGFEEQTMRHTVNGRVFGSLLFPRREKMTFTLKTQDPAAAFAVYAAEFTEWTFGGEPTASWQIPLILSEGVYRTGPETAEKEELEEILIAASRFTVTRAALRDLLRAKTLLDNMGYAPSAVSLLNSISDIFVFLSQNPGSAEWLCNLFPSNSPVARAIKDSQWYSSSVYSPVIIPDGAGDTYIEIAELSFADIPSAVITLDENSPLSAQNNTYINGFYMCDTSVPLPLFEKFLEENPGWTEHYTEYYPQEIEISPLGVYKGNAATGITWYAAEAFCKWLTGFLPASLADMEVRLPTEDEWSIAALFISNMRFPGWEWCIDPYSPLPSLKASKQAIETVGSPERSLRGRQSVSSTETRASLPPDFSSPFVTLRPVIAEKK